MVMLLLEPVLEFPSVAVRVTLPVAVAVALTVAIPPASVAGLGVKFTLPELLIVTCVELSVVSVLSFASLAVTVKLNAFPTVWGDVAETV